MEKFDFLSPALQQLVEKPKDSRASTPGHEHLPPLPDLVATGKHPVTPIFAFSPTSLLCYSPLWSAGKSPPSQVELEE